MTGDSPSTRNGSVSTGRAAGGSAASGFIARATSTACIESRQNASSRSAADESSLTDGGDALRGLAGSGAAAPNALTTDESEPASAARDGCSGPPTGVATRSFSNAPQ